jgi:hypothetical protein
MSSTLGASDPIQTPTDSTGAAWGGVPSGLAQAAPDASPQDAEAQAIAEYNSNPALKAYIQNNFGYVSWMLNNPELLGVIAAAAVNGWDQARVDGALFQTQWWTQNGSAVRNFQQMQSTDPASAAQEVAAQKATIQTQAQTLGVQLTDDQLTNLATQSATFQWNGDQIMQALRSAYTSPTAGQAPLGTAADMQAAVRQSAGQYLMPSSENMVNFWTTAAIQKGQSTQQMQEELNNYLGQQATQRFPWMSTAISMGMTPQQYLDPYTQQAAKTLAISPDSIDWSDPKWAGALLTTNPDGTQVPKNSDQFNKTLMQNPTFGYSKTAGAIDQAYSTVRTLEQTFGATKT